MSEDSTASLDALPRDARLSLLRFVCSFAWADLEIADDERSFVSTLIDKLHLDDEERAMAAEWLKLPPDPDEVDPTDVPREHRQVFLKTVLDLVQADGVIDPDEVETFALFEQLMR